MSGPQSPPDPDHDPRRRADVGARDAAQLTEGLKRLASSSDSRTGWRLGSRFRNAFFTGLVIVGPVTITLWIMWGVIHWIDAWIKPLLPTTFNPDTYLPFPLPGLGLVVAIIGLTIIGALAANLLGRTLVSSGELMLSRTPIVRNVYGALKQIFESVISTTGPSQSFQKVGMIEFPSKEIWSLVFVTGPTMTRPVKKALRIRQPRCQPGFPPSLASRLRPSVSCASVASAPSGRRGSGSGLDGGAFILSYSGQKPDGDRAPSVCHDETI
jgi:hypothetical protein